MTTSRTPLLVVLSGPSGVGKDTVIHRLQSQLTDLDFAITATTRPPRPGEVDGKSYFFLNQDEYDAMLDRGQLLAPAEVHGYWYGAPADRIREAIEAGRDVLLKIDVQGAMHVRRRFPQAVFIFLAPASMSDLVAQLKARDTESHTDLQRRLNDAQFEMDQLPQYDYVVVNQKENVDAAVRDVCCIISAERLRVHRQPICVKVGPYG